MTMSEHDTCFYHLCFDIYKVVSNLNNKKKAEVGRCSVIHLFVEPLQMVASGSDIAYGKMLF